MQNLLYQGQQIEAQVVNVERGSLCIATFPAYELTHQGEETLLRDTQGQYYLRRHLSLCDVGGARERRASGRVHVHRLSLTAAMQWASVRANAYTYHLRQDVTQALTAARGYLLPDDPESLPVALVLPVDLYRQVLAMSAYDETHNFQATVRGSLRGDVQAWLEGDEQGKAPKRFLRQYERELDAGLHPEVWPPGQSDAAEPPVEKDSDEAGEDATILNHLDAQLGLRVLRYLYVSPWAYRAADVVTGCVEYALDHAFNDLANLHGGRVPQGKGFSDDGWGYVEEKICQAAQQRSGGQSIARKPSHPARHEDRDEDDVPLEVEDLRGLPATDRSDVAVAAAAAVESVDEEDEDEQATDQPLRPVLAALAAEWQAKAQEARTQAGQFASLSAGNKFTAQADLLEGCAGALRAALEGKEGK